MAEEEEAVESTGGEVTEEVTSEATEATEEATEEVTEDWQAKYKELEAHSTKSSQELSELKELQEAIDPYIDWDGVEGRGKKTPAEDDGSGDELVDKKTLQKTVQTLQRQVAIGQQVSRFRTDNPDLVEHEDLVGFYLTNKTKGPNHEKRMDQAVTMVRELLGKTKAEGAKEAIDKKKAVAKAAGISSSQKKTTPSPAKDSGGGESNSDYIAQRRARLASRQVQ